MVLNLRRIVASFAARITVCFLMIMSGSASGVEPEIMVSVEKSGEAFIVEATIEVQVPLRMAWEVLTDFDNMAGILSNLTSSRIIRRKGNIQFVQQEGSARYGLFSYSFASEREIRLEPMQRIFARQIAGNAKRLESQLELSPNGPGTRLRYHAEIVPDSGIARTFGGPFIQHEVEEQFVAMAAEMLRRKSR